MGTYTPWGTVRPALTFSMSRSGTTPMMVLVAIPQLSGPNRICAPRGFPPGKKRVAKLWLMTATGGAPGPSSGPKVRPARTVASRAAK